MAYDPHKDKRPIPNTRVRSNIRIAIYAGWLLLSAGAAIFAPPGGYFMAAILVPLAVLGLWRELRKP